jgi:hypothetical protein
MLSPDGLVNSWNAGAQRFKGYLPHEIIGRHFSVFYTDEERAAGIPAYALDTALRTRQVRGRGLARAQGRHALLGQRGDRPDPRRRRRR